MTPAEDASVLERRHMDDLRDRLARAEQDIKNHKENFAAFKAEDFGALKQEVHTMRGEFNTKLDKLLDKISNIDVTMAKWLGMGVAAVFVIELTLKFYFK